MRVLGMRCLSCFGDSEGPLELASLPSRTSSFRSLEEEVVATDRQHDWQQELQEQQEIQQQLQEAAQQQMQQEQQQEQQQQQPQEGEAEGVDHNRSIFSSARSANERGYQRKMLRAVRLQARMTAAGQDEQQQDQSMASRVASRRDRMSRVVLRPRWGRDYIVLRAPAHATAAGSPGVPAAAGSTVVSSNVGCKVTCEKLTDDDAVALLKSDPTVRAVVRDCPTRLVEPVRIPQPHRGFRDLIRAASTFTRLVEPVPSMQLTAAAAGSCCTWGIAAVGAANSPYDGDGVTVAVLDTGYDPEHPAFASLLRRSAILSRDFTNSEDGVRDTHGHGTHVLATIVGQDVPDSSNSSSGSPMRIGIARGVSKVLVGKVLADNGTGKTSWLVKGLKWAWKNGAHVINISLEFDFASLPDKMMQGAYAGADRKAASRRLTDFVLREQHNNTALLHHFYKFCLLEQGFSPVIIAAAGNASIRDSSKPEVEQALVSAGLPALLEFVVSVAAVDSTRQVASFSNCEANVSGPGVGVLSAQSSVLTKGKLLTVLDGTSMAAPHVAGVAALWWQKLIRDGVYGPRPPADWVITSLKHSCSVELANYNPRDFGQGLVQAPSLSTPKPSPSKLQLADGFWSPDCSIQMDPALQVVLMQQRNAADQLQQFKLVVMVLLVVVIVMVVVLAVVALR